MRVRDAKIRLCELERLADNLKKYLTYMKLETDTALEEYANDADLNLSVIPMLETATEEIVTIAGKYARAIEEAEITEIVMR